MAIRTVFAGLGMLALAGQLSVAEDGFEFDDSNRRSFTASLPHGIASGDTTGHSTLLWTRSALTGNVRFQVKDGRKVVADHVVEVKDIDLPAKFSAQDLRPDKKYRYQVTAPDGQSLNGTFKTAPGSFSRRGLRFGVSGDWRGELAPYPAISNADDKSLDFFVKLGDTIYADIASPSVPQGQAKTLAEYRAKHQEVYGIHQGINSFADLQRKVSVFSTIDDHEVINDFAGGALASSDPRLASPTGLVNQSALYQNGLQAFVEYNPIFDKRYPIAGDARTDGRPDLYRSQRYGKQAALFMLDARSFRDQELPGVGNITDPAEIGGFIARSFDAGQNKVRTMLGEKQLNRLQADLLSAQQDGVVWKFVMVPEPIQNLGVFGAGDRFEGYASERSALLEFIDEEHISNVVFVAADIHGTIINDLTYQRREEVLKALATSGNPLAAPQRTTSAFEITTGSVAFSPAFGDAVTGLLAVVPGGNALLQSMFSGLKVSSLDEFKALPASVKNTALQQLVDTQLNALGYTSIGLQGNPLIKAKLKQGGNVGLYSFGWTEFQIQPWTSRLEITTYGIEPYTAKDMQTNKADVLKRKPSVISKLEVLPQ